MKSKLNAFGWGIVLGVFFKGYLDAMDELRVVRAMKIGPIH